MRKRTETGMRGILLAGLVLLVPAAPAAAQIDAAMMRRDMHTYFDGETSEAYFWLGVGTLAVGSSTLALTLSDADSLHGAAWPVLAIGVIQAAAGIVLFARTPGQVHDLDAQLDRDAAGFRHDELERIEGVNTEFDVLLWVEAGLCAAGAGLGFYGLARDDRDFDFWTGLGFGLAVQAAVMAIFDGLAAIRADRYTESLHDFTP